MIEKIKVFISGNQKELKKERLAVKEAIFENTVLRKFFDVFMFEELPAKGKPPALTYFREFREGIPGTRYLIMDGHNCL